MEILNIKDPAFASDPYPALKRVREAGPLCWIEPFHFVGVTRYEDVAAVLRNPKIFSSSGTQDAFPVLKGAEFFSRMGVLIGNDPPQHTRVRRLIQKAFTLQEMAAWEPKIELLTSRLVQELKSRPEFDLINELAMPLPVMVISEMLGVDNARRLDFKRWSDDMVSIRSVQISDNHDWRQKRESEIIRSCAEFTEYFTGIISDRRRDPSGDDLISAMVRASENEDILRADEVLGLTRLMLVAGNETTTNLLGNAMVALLSSPTQWVALTENPDLAGAVVEEALRFDGPVIHLTRRTVEDTEIAGQKIASETFVAPIIASANHDPRKFERPDSFDIHRTNAASHLAFGLGVHLCVGAPLARLESRIALKMLATELKNLKLAQQHSIRLESLVLRGHKSLYLDNPSAFLNGFKGKNEKAPDPKHSTHV